MSCGRGRGRREAVEVSNTPSPSFLQLDPRIVKQENLLLCFSPPCSDGKG